MESGAGKHWTKEEVKALLSVWAEKNIRKQLYGTLRNKGIFIYIAKRLQSLGVHRDWKQCRAKYKNLKYEYRTVKYAHKSGDSSKTMKFFHDLDAILQYEPTTQFTEEDANGRCLETLSPSTAPETTEGISTSVLEPSNNTTFIPTVANEGGKHWTVSEVRALIDIWSDKSIQRQLEGTVRNKRIFEQIAGKLQKFGIERDWKQCRTKYKNLKHEYKIVRTAQDLGMTKSMKFFTELDAILGHNKTEKSRGQESQDGEPVTECANIKMGEDQTAIAGDVAEGDSVSNKSEDIGDTDTKQSPDTELFEGHNKSQGTLSFKRKAHEDETVSLSLKKSTPEIITNQFPQSIITEPKDSTERFCRQETQLHQVNLINF
ncbi:uncharacterized protein LOC108296114 [Cebus imitator]|uniref:uncharacterized protein LOC108296114 n=1 Tax=Cebus imitator TaxID=2715852 RepID=UPI00080A39A9|nr:uncharacterized protein LOC108296114 [Cebus imitator]